MQDGSYPQIHGPDENEPTAPAGRLRLFWQCLTSPRERDEDDARREYMTRVILLMTAVTMAIFSLPVIAGWVLGSYEFQDAATILLGDALIFGGLWFTQWGHWRKTRYIPPLLTFLLASLITASNGLLNTGLLFYVAGILLTSMLIGIKAQWLMVALSAVVYLLLGWLYERTSLYDISTIAITVSSSFVGIALLQWLLVHLLQQALRSSLHYAERLEHRTVELDASNKDLNKEIGERERAEKLLRESEERYRTLFENAPIGLGLAERSGKLLDFNAAMLSPGGYTPEEIFEIGNVADLYYDLEEREQARAAANEQGFLNQYEVRFKRRDGTPYDALLSLTPVTIEGRPCWQAMVEDITERKKAENELLNVNRALKVLSNSNQAVIRAVEEGELLHEICRGITEDGKYHFAWVGYVEQGEEKTLHLVAQAGGEPSYAEQFRIAGSGNGGGSDPTRTAIRTKQPVILKDIRNDESAGDRTIEGYPSSYASSISLPLIANGAILGALNIYSQQPDAFHPEEVRLLDKLADDLAFGIATLRTRAQHQQAEQRIQRQLETMSALRTIDMTITASLDLRFTFDVILNQITGTLGVDAATILIYKPQIQTLDFAAGRGFRTGALQHTHLRLGQGNAGRAALKREIIHIPNVNRVENDLEASPLFPDEDFVVYTGVPLVAKGQVKGVLEIFNRSPLDPDQEWMDLLKAMAAQAAIAIDNAELFRSLQQSNQDLLMAYEFTLEGWAKALELRDAETEGHTQRVSEMTLRLARAMGISEEQLVHIRRGTLLHDIGKMGIPDSILLKPGPLTEEEWEIMRQHPTYAYQLFSAIPYLRAAVDIPYCHHEKWDGTGYPRGLKGELIPLPARIFAVVDVWDALRSDRPYRSAWPDDKVRQYLEEQAGKHFDPAVVEKFLELI